MREEDPGCQRGAQPHLVTYRSHAGQQETLCRFSTVATNSPSTPAWAPDLPDGAAAALFPATMDNPELSLFPLSEIRSIVALASVSSPTNYRHLFFFFFFFRPFCLAILLSPPSPRERSVVRTVNDPRPPPTVSACAASSRGTLRDVHIGIHTPRAAAHHASPLGDPTARFQRQLSERALCARRTGSLDTKAATGTRVTLCRNVMCCDT